MGNKILRQRLRGPALASYYPRRTWKLREMQDLYGPELEIPNDEEEDRLEHIALLKLRGKGAPKKKSGPPGRFPENDMLAYKILTHVIQTQRAREDERRAYRLYEMPPAWPYYFGRNQIYPSTNFTVLDSFSSWYDLRIHAKDAGSSFFMLQC